VGRTRAVEKAFEFPIPKLCRMPATHNFRAHVVQDMSTILVRIPCRFVLELNFMFMPFGQEPILFLTSVCILLYDSLHGCAYDYCPPSYGQFRRGKSTGDR
jgi:hypothetical protein